jgi:hypothetical protein
MRGFRRHLSFLDGTETAASISLYLTDYWFAGQLFNFPYFTTKLQFAPSFLQIVLL